MPPETLKALKESVAHWERLLACKTKQELEAEGYGAEHCALCEMFSENPQCNGCPVAESTGEDSCDGTPYYKADKELDRYLGYWVVNPRKTFPRKQVKAELDFLKSLLPVKEQLRG